MAFIRYCKIKNSMVRQYYSDLHLILYLFSLYFLKISTTYMIKDLFRDNHLQFPIFHKVLVRHSTHYCNYFYVCREYFLQSMIMYLLLQTSSWTCIALGNICLDSVLVCNVSLCCRLLPKFEFSVPLLNQILFKSIC